MSNIKSWITWLAAFLLAAAFLVGVPVLLLASPSPLDADRGVRSIIEAVLTNGQVFEEALVSVVVALAWVLWAYVVASALFAVVGAVRGAAVNINGFGFGQRLVAPIVTALMWSSTATTLAMSVVGAGGLTMATSSLAAAQETVIEEDTTTPGEEAPTNVEQISGNLVLVNGHLARAHLVVINGDTMWDLAEKHLGDAFRWTEIADLNLGLAQPTTPTVTNADLIWPDTVLLMPEGAVGVVEPSAAQVEALCRNQVEATSGEPSEVVVVKDDTLWDLSEEHLGDPFRWPELAAGTVGVPQANSPVVTDPDLIWPGTVVQLPGSTDTAAGVVEDCEPDLVVLEANPSGVETDGVVVVEELRVWTPDADRSSDDSVIGSGVQDIGLRTTSSSAASAVLPWWLIAAAATAAGVFAAGMLRVLATRRERSAALGEDFDDELLEDFDEPARSTRDHLLAASASLSRWVSEVDVFLFQVDRDKTSAVFVGGDIRPHATSPWQFGSTDGSLSTWELAHDEVDAAEGSYCLWGFGNGVFFNLEELGSIAVAGPEEEQMMAMLRHMLHDVLGNFGQDHDVIVRVGAAVGDIDEISCYGVRSSTAAEQMRAEVEHLFREVDTVHEARKTTLLAEMRDEDAPYPTLLLVLTPEERAELEDLQEHLEANPGRYPIVMLTVGAGAVALWTVRVESEELATVGSERLGDQRLSGAPSLMERDEALRISQALGGHVDRAPIVSFLKAEPQDSAAALSPKDASYVAAMAAAGIEHVDTELVLVTSDEDKNVEGSETAHSDESVMAELHDEFDEDECESDDWRNDAAGERNNDGDAAGDAEEESSQSVGTFRVAEQMSGAYATLTQGELGAEVDGDVGVSDGDQPDELLFDLVDTNGLFGRTEALENPVGPGHRVAAPPENLEVSPGLTSAKIVELATGAMVSASSTTEVADIAFFGKVTVAGDDLSAAAAAGSAILAWFGPISRERWVDLLWDGKTVQPRRVRAVLVEIRNQWGPVFSDLDGSLNLRVSTDVGLASGLIGQSVSLDWSAAMLRLMQASELCRGEIFAEAPGGRWWQWTGIEIESARQDRSRKLLDDLVDAAKRARVEGDLAMVERLCAAARRVNPVAMAPVEMMAECLVLDGQRDRALEVIEDWEQRYENRFDEEAPETVRAQVPPASVLTG